MGCGFIVNKNYFIYFSLKSFWNYKSYKTTLRIPQILPFLSQIETVKLLIVRFCWTQCHSSKLLFCFTHPSIKASKLSIPRDQKLFKSKNCSLSASPPKNYFCCVSYKTQYTELLFSYQQNVEMFLPR